MSEECLDLKNIKYQTMLLNGNSKIDSDKSNTLNVDDLLNQETSNNKKKPWNKLGQTERRKKVDFFIKSFSPKSKQPALNIYLNKCLKNKKLQRTKDVIYDLDKGIIKSIPGLKYDNSNKKFTLKRVDKKNSTLKGLPMRHRQKTKTKAKIKIKSKEKQKIKTKIKTKSKEKQKKAKSIIVKE